MSIPSDRRGFPRGTLLLAGLLSAAMLLTYLLVRPPSPPEELRDVLRPGFRPLAPFYLNSRSHGPIGRDDLRGRWTFVFFGERSCPDPCRSTLRELAAFRRLLDDADAAGDVQVLFVSLDPARDSEEDLAKYLAHFNPRLIGATAGRAALERFARQFGVVFMAGPERLPASGPASLTVSHDGDLFLVDPHARIVASFSRPHHAATLMAQFDSIAAYYAASG